MHKLGHWSVRRSGAHVSVHGFNEAGEAEKFTASSVEGPTEGRVCAPGSTIAIKLDGTPVELVADFSGAIIRY
jgi:hypothetical protein